MKTPSRRLPAALLATLLLATAGCAKDKPSPADPTASTSPAATPGNPAPALNAPAPATVTTTTTSVTTVPPPAPAPVMPAPSAPAAIVTPDPFSEINIQLENATYKQHDDLSGTQTRMDAAISDQLSAWKAAGHPMVTASGDKLSANRSDFADKIRTLTLASEDTWPSAKHDAEMSLQNVRSALSEAMLDPVPEKTN